MPFVFSGDVLRRLHAGALYLGAVLLLVLVLPAATYGQDATPLSQQISGLQAARVVPSAQMPPLNNAALRAQHPISGGGPLHFAESIETQISPQQNGLWESAKSDQRIWRMRIHSEGARSLNLGFTRYHMPPGGQLFLYPPDTSTVIGPFTAADNESHGELWTPIIPGDEVIVEINLPADQTAALDLRLGQVNHGYRSLDAAKSSGDCNVDVACPEADPWREQVSAVGAYSLGGQILCSGVVMNNTAEDRTPYFLTANHCSVSSTNAASMVVYWNFENSTCRPIGDAGGPGDGTLDQFNTGAILRAKTGASQPQYNFDIQGADFTLVELDDSIDPAFNVFYAGWSRTDTAPPEAVAIHHPDGEEKRISFENDPTTVTSYAASDTTLAPTHIRVGDWDLGTTEPGSSGSPLFTPQKRVIGILSGGSAACGNDEPDWYGRLAVAWTGGGTPETRLQDWLDPLGLNPVAINGNGFGADQTAPATVEDLRVTSITEEGIGLTWTAPGDDGMTGTADLYELRYATYPILTEADFNEATPVSTVPLPDSAGTEQTTLVSSLSPETPYYFALVAEDESGNVSGIASTRENAVILERPFVLRSPFPNPFQSATTLQFAINERESVTITLYDALGRHVRTTYRQTPPTNTLQDVRIRGQGLASGRYFIRVVGESFAATKLVTIVR